MDKLTQKDHSYRLSREEFESFQGQWYLTLNKSGKNAPMRLRSEFRAAVTIKSGLHRESGEEVGEPISPQQYRRWHSSSSDSWWNWDTSKSWWISKPKEVPGSCQQLCAHVGSVGFVYLRHLSCVPSCRVFFLHGVFLSSFHVHPCLFASRALELMSAQFPLM